MEIFKLSRRRLSWQFSIGYNLANITQKFVFLELNIKPELDIFRLQTHQWLGENSHCLYPATNWSQLMSVCAPIID